MHFAAWIYDNYVCPWTKVFDLTVEQNPKISNCPYDSLVETLIDCDLNGFVKNGFHDISVSYYLDSMFEFYGVNLKECYSHRSLVKIDEKPVFEMAYHPSLMPEPVKDPSPDKSAQITFIDEKYVYFNMSSYSFWDPLDKFIANTFNSSNIGGWLVDISKFPEITPFIPPKAVQEQMR